MARTERARPAIPDPTAAGVRLTALTDRLAARPRIAHVAVGVASGDGSFTWQGAAGKARPGAPMRPETPWFIASVTKLFIAVTVLQQHERGELDLDASITTYLPRALTDGLHRFDGRDRTADITVRHLLGHTSGLPDHLEDAPEGERSLYARLAAGEDVGWDLDELTRRVRDRLEPAFPPQDLRASRQKARYSDTGFQLLIAIVEATTGAGFHAVLLERLLRPLGMVHTYVPGHSEPLEPTGEPAVLAARGRPLHIPRAMASFRDLIATTDDLLRFGRAVARGEVFAEPTTYLLMHAHLNRLFYPLSYGLGMMRFRVGRALGPGHRPVTLLGHSGSTGSWLFHCPELDVVVTGTVEALEARAVPFRVMPRILKAVHE